MAGFMANAVLGSSLSTSAPVMTTVTTFGACLAYLAHLRHTSMTVPPTGAGVLPAGACGVGSSTFFSLTAHSAGVVLDIAATRGDTLIGCLQRIVQGDVSVTVPLVKVLQAVTNDGTICIGSSYYPE